MRDTSLTSPGLLSNGFLLRREAAKAISAIEIAARATSGGKTSSAKQLKAFFDSCSSALTALVDSVLPTVTTRVRTAANTVVITCSEPLSPSTSVPLTSFVFAPARTVTAVVVSGSTITITATGALAGDTVAYTAPTNGSAHLGVQDLAGNKLASFAAAAVA